MAASARVVFSMKSLLALFASFFFATDLFIWWCGSRILRRNRARRGLILAFHVFMAFQILAQVLIVWARSRHINVDAFFPIPLMIATFIWHFILAPVAVVLYLLELAREGVSWLWSWLRARRSAPVPAPVSTPEAVGPGEKGVSPQTEMVLPAGSILSRRQFLSAGVALTPPFFNVSISTIASRQIQHFRVRRLTTVIPQLPRALDGLTIAHVSDTHVGRFSHGEVLQKVSDVTNALKAEMVIFTGDLVNDSLAWLPAALEMLARVDSPIVLCEGNHDLIDDPFEFRTRVKSAPNLTLLLNEARTLEVRGVPIQLLGLCWNGPGNSIKKQWKGEYALGRSTEMLLRNRDPSAFPILLAHHPHAWDHAQDIPLTLSGHTHGGQLMLNEELGAGPILFRYWSGLYTRDAANPAGAGSLVVSNGVGNWFPLRIGAPAEIIHLTLRAPKA